MYSKVCKGAMRLTAGRRGCLKVGLARGQDSNMVESTCLLFLALSTEDTIRFMVTSDNEYQQLQFMTTAVHVYPQLYMYNHSCTC